MSVQRVPGQNGLLISPGNIVKCVTSQYYNLNLDDLVLVDRISNNGSCIGIRKRNGTIAYRYAYNFNIVEEAPGYLYGISYHPVTDMGLVHLTKYPKTPKEDPMEEQPMMFMAIATDARCSQLSNSGVLTDHQKILFDTNLVRLKRRVSELGGNLPNSWFFTKLIGEGRVETKTISEVSFREF